jgi:hypothetical protein
VIGFLLFGTLAVLLGPTIVHSLAPRPDGYLAADATTAEYFQFSDDGWSSHTIAGAFLYATQTSDQGFLSGDLPFDGTRNGDNFNLNIRAPLGVTVPLFGSFGFLELTVTIHVTNSSTGCVEGGTISGASVTQYNAAVDRVRTTPPPTSSSTGPQTCQ